MKAIITADNNRLLRIGDGNGAYISLRIEGNTAGILSVTVPSGDRRHGTGTVLLKAAETVLSARKVTGISVDYIDSIEGMSAFLLANGFKEKRGAAILAYNEKAIRNSSALDKLLKYKTSDIKTVRLEDLSLSKWDEMTEFLTEAGVDLTCYDLAHMDLGISSVIYDPTGRIGSVFLGSVRDEDVYAQLLLTRPGEEHRLCTLAAIQNLLRSVMTPEGEYLYDRVLFAAYNSGVVNLIERMQREKIEPERIGRCLSASKTVSTDPGEIAIDIETGIEDGSESGWIRELARIPMQRIISWKAPWYRNTQ